MPKAVFLDRDGVINPLMYNPATREYEPPHKAGDFAIYHFAEKSLCLLKAAGYKIILVSNQPDVAKGKATMEQLLAVANVFEAWANERGGLIDKFCYCYHHPDGIMPKYTKTCGCRKPGVLFLEQAKSEYRLDPASCWLIGDRDTDIECGKRFGCKTVKIDNAREPAGGMGMVADFRADTLFGAAHIILEAAR